ncbi:MAG: dolichol monophosphate mannose synthase [Sphingomonadales bacterium CG12_big_fil_rev_8_21_14_0_65_65_10]|jgi:dolichol-phosphate mannosyltransferase|uniref:glycosyltransferase n=1 Tax=Blastomonas marina TaxID=1867408 RepID=UPI000CBB8307|nr:glycosyltransferase family 2 protein [Blastomonas marina]PIW55302.1 MAG: dolichol monophosphate mannose synthase [Sphingomonadales bacterium CG12_big_fil_rev_8_21_14_0_65_65_10]WPZ02685.1 glycosyltransferase family 2 protein [Blastomonas marina]
MATQTIPPSAEAPAPGHALKLAVVLPTLNERDNLAPLVARLEQALGPDGWEAIFVDDNSPDGTSDAARALALKDRRVRVIQRIGRRGLASAAIEGMLSTAAPYVAVMDADHQHDPNLLPQMLAALDSGEAEVAVGSRFVEGGSAAGLSSATREKGSHLANGLARRLTGVELTDPMSGFFMLPSATLRATADRLSGIGFKILLDILATADEPYRVKEFPLKFAERASGESKLDRTVVFEYLIGLYDRWLGHIIPTRFALFGTIGAAGVVVHMAVLALFLESFGGTFRNTVVTPFEVGQTIAALVAMTFNFVLNNALTYADKRLSGFGELVAGWIKFALTCSIGLLANIGVAAVLVRYDFNEYVAALAGIVIGSVWNFALSSRFVWGKY